MLRRRRELESLGRRPDRRLAIQSLPRMLGLARRLRDQRTVGPLRCFREKIFEVAKLHRRIIEKPHDEAQEHSSNGPSRLLKKYPAWL